MVTSTEARTRTKTFPVIEIFGPTIQGEGALAGLPTYFIRFGGCETRGDADLIELGKLLADLDEAMARDDLMRALPFTAYELENLLSLAATDWDQYPVRDGFKPDQQSVGDEVVVSFMMSAAQRERFAAWLSLIRHELSLGTDTEAVIAAAERAAQELNQTAAPSGR